MSLNHVYRIEAGHRNISFPLALACAEIFDSLLVRCDGKFYTISRGGEMQPVGPDDDRATTANKDRQAPGLGEAALSAMQEASDVPPAINKLAKHLRSITPTADGPAHDVLIDSAVEILDVHEAAEDFLTAAEERHPGVIDEAEARRQARETTAYEGGRVA